MANDPTRFSAGNGRTGNSANYHFSSNVIATEPATKSTSLYALVPGKPRERGMRSSAPDVNLHRSTLSLSDMSDELVAAAVQAGQPSEPYVYKYQDPEPTRNEVSTQPVYETGSYTVGDYATEPGHQRDDGLFTSHRITRSHNTSPVRRLSAMDVNHSGSVPASEHNPRTAHWPTAGITVGGNAPMHLYYKSTEEHLNHGHGLPIESRKEIKIGAHPDQPSRNDGTAQLLMAKSLIAKGTSQELPKAGIESGQINYTPQHVRFASHWEVDHGHGDHTQETTSAAGSKWVADNVRDGAPSAGAAHSGPAPITTGLASMPTAGMVVGGNEPQYLRYSSTMDPVSHGQGDHMQRGNTASQAVYGYQADALISQTLPTSPGPYHQPDPTLAGQAMDAKEKVMRARALEGKSSFTISHGHDSRDVRRQSTYMQHHGNHTGVMANPEVYVPPGTSSARRAEDFKPHSSACIPGSGFR